MLGLLCLTSHSFNRHGITDLGIGPLCLLCSALTSMAELCTYKLRSTQHIMASLSLLRFVRLCTILHSYLCWA
jgi:hypothetical protein